MTKKKSTMKGSAGVLYCGSTSCIITDKAAMTAEKTISRTENFLIGIVFAMVRMLFETKGVFDNDIEGNEHTCQRANQCENRLGVQPFVKFYSSKHSCGNDKHHFKCQTRITGIVVHRPGVLGSLFSGLRHLALLLDLICQN